MIYVHVNTTVEPVELVYSSRCERGPVVITSWDMNAWVKLSTNDQMYNSVVAGSHRFVHTATASSTSTPSVEINVCRCM